MTRGRDDPSIRRLRLESRRRADLHDSGQQGVTAVDENLAGLERRPLALLDRDGVLNKEVGFAHRPEQITWIDGALAALARLNTAGYRVVVVTNQSGVARGLYSEADVIALHGWMSEVAKAHGGRIDAFYFCPFHPEATIEAYRMEHLDRKPSPGMVLRALADFPTDRSRTFLIGDRQSDIEAAKAAGLPGLLFQGGDLDVFVTDTLSQISKMSF